MPISCLIFAEQHRKVGLSYKGAPAPARRRVSRQLDAPVSLRRRAIITKAAVTSRKHACNSRRSLTGHIMPEAGTRTGAPATTVMIFSGFSLRDGFTLY